MSPVLLPCVLCGYTICDVPAQTSRSWLREFRIVYSTSEEAHLSGVGIYDESTGDTWSAPLDPNKNWGKTEDRSQQGLVIPVMTQRPDNKLHGYVLHEACWMLLEKFVSPHPVALDRLFQLCESLPFPLRFGGLSWGHKYGGLAFYDDENNYPWEDRFKMHETSWQDHSNAIGDPYNVSEVATLLQLQSQRPPSGPSRWTRDCFAAFPWEILEIMAVYLPTQDALRLRLASRSFLGVFDSQRFWASRFYPAADHGFLFEALGDGKTRDWRTLWRATACHSRHGMQNRRRVWSLIQILGDLLDLRLCQVQALSQCEGDLTSGASTIAAADLSQERVRGRYAFFNEGSTVHGKQHVTIPLGLSRLAVTIVNTGGPKYISGLRLASAKAPDICLGYVSKSKEITLQVSRIRGFVLAMGSRGLHALQVVDGDGLLSHWLGDPTNAPITERLTGFESFSTLEAGFDGFKLVYIALAKTSPRPTDHRIASVHALRRKAYWYPAVPPPYLNLNDHSFTGEDPISSGYAPVFWAQFGGPKGSHLQHLTCVSVTRLDTLCNIEFKYVNEANTSNQTLGRHQFTDSSQVLNFPIDGPGGEVIRAVEVSLQRCQSENAFRYYKHGKLESLKLTTSWQRCFHFLPRRTQAQDVTLKKLEIAPGTTITGFYATQHPEAGLVSLGAISERLEKGHN